MSRAAPAAVCALLVACHSGAPPEPRAEPDAAPTTAAAPSDGAAASAPAPPDAIGMPPSAIAAVVNPMGLPPYRGPTGSVEGTVFVRGAEAPDVPGLDVHACPAALDTYGKAFRAGPVRPDSKRPLADALVVVTGYSGAYLPEKDDVVKVTIGQNCAYPTRTIAMTYGQRLDVYNESPLSFAPQIEGGMQLSVMVVAPTGHSGPAKIFPPRADRYVLHDQLQKFVSGEVYVLRQPLHAVTGLDGHFRIDGVPVGAMKVGVHAEKPLGDVTSDANVVADGVAHAYPTLIYLGGASPPR